MPKINKIIFFLEQHFSLRNYKRFGIEIIRDNGFEVQVWDFTHCLQPQAYRRVGVTDPIDYEGHRLFATKDEINKAISMLKEDSFIVSLIDYNRNTYGIYRAISKRHLKYCLFMANILPYDYISDIRGKMFFRKLMKKVKNLTFAKIINFMALHIPPRMVGIRPVDLILAGGEKSILYQRQLIGAKTEILWLHTLDYDIYLEEIKKRDDCVDNRTGVFLDEYVPFHSDYLNAGIEPFSSPEEYYPSLCRFFDFLEKTYDTKIMIAAHPRSHYESHPDYFKNRPVIKGRTLEMVKRSRFVITHSSTSVNFAVLCKKPIIFITTNSLRQSMKGQWIEVMASALGKKVININENREVDFNREMVINEAAYDNYKNAYIKKEGSEELPFWQIFSSYLKNLDKT